MKNLIYFLVLILILFSCKKDEENTSPVAFFEIYPTCVGTILTEFTLDASLSYDEEGSIELRWDVDGDLKWDTEYSKIFEYKTTYPAKGIYKVTLEVADEEGWTQQASKNITIVAEPLNLIALFIINPLSGDTSTVFFFDATESSDPNYPEKPVKVRWDFEGDGIWDTGFFEEKTAYHEKCEQIS